MRIILSLVLSMFTLMTMSAAIAAEHLTKATVSRDQSILAANKSIYIMNWISYYRKWSRNKTNTSFNDANIATLKVGFTPLSSAVSNMRLKYITELTALIDEKFNTFQGQLLFKSKSGIILRGAIELLVQPEIDQMELLPKADLKKLTDIELAMVEQVFTRYFYEGNSDQQRQSIARYFIENFYMYYDNAFSEAKIKLLK
jgi:hypothetical protein